MPIAKGLPGEGTQSTAASDGEGVGSDGLPLPRKRRKVGICRKRGCYAAVADASKDALEDAGRYCPKHLAQLDAMGASPSGNPVEAQAPQGAQPVRESTVEDTEPHTVSDGGTCAEAAQSDEEKGYTTPQCPAEGCTLRQTMTGFCAVHTPLPVRKCVECDAILGREVPGPRCSVCAEEAMVRGAEILHICRQFDCQLPQVEAGYCQRHAEALGLVKTATCRNCGIQRVNSDPQGELCSSCATARRVRGAAENKCARRGCSEARAFGGIFCTGHAACAASVSCDNLPAIPEEHEQPNDRQPEDVVLSGGTQAKRPERAIRYERACLEFAELLWDQLADDPSMDRATVEACRSLRNDERLFIQIFVQGGRS